MPLLVGLYVPSGFRGVVVSLWMFFVDGDPWICLTVASLVSSEPIGGGGSGVVGLGALSSVTALSSPSPNDDRSRFSARGSISFSLLVSVLSVC